MVPYYTRPDGLSSSAPPAVLSLRPAGVEPKPQLTTQGVSFKVAEFVTHSELDDAIQAVREDIVDTETRLRTEFTNTVRYEVGRVDDHLGVQDTRISWVLGLIVTLLITTVGGLLYVALSH